MLLETSETRFFETVMAHPLFVKLTQYYRPFEIYQVYQQISYHFVKDSNSSLSSSEQALFVSLENKKDVSYDRLGAVIDDYKQWEGHLTFEDCFM